MKNGLELNKINQNNIKRYLYILYINMDRVNQMLIVQKEGLELFKKKNTDYGDSFAQFGPIGVIIRMQDKINRLANISKTNITLVESESLRDTLIDLHNYSAMAIMLLDEKDKHNDKEITNEITNEITTTASVGHELYLEDNINKLTNENEIIHQSWGQWNYL